MLSYLHQNLTRLAKPGQQSESNDGKPAALGLRWQDWAAITLLFLALTILITWPTVLHFTDGVPKGGIEDRFQNLWNFWWIKEALFHLDNPFRTPVLYYPYFGPSHPLELYFHDLQLFNGIITLPFQLIFGIASAYNSVIFISFTLAGVGAFGVAYYFTRSYIASILAGIIYTFNMPHWDTIVASITNIMSTQYLPFYILFLHLGLANKQWRYLGLAGITLAACIYTDWYNTLYLGLYTIYLLLVQLYHYKANFQKITRVLIAGLTGLALGSPLLVATLLAFRNSIYSSQLGTDRDLRASAALSTLFNPFSYTGLVVWCSLIASVFLIFHLIRLRKIIYYWLGFFGLCLLLALGPKLQIIELGNPEPTDLPLPYAILKYIPGVSSFRAPERFLIPAHLAAGILIAFAISFAYKSLTEKKGRYLAVAGSVAVSLFFLVCVNRAPLEISPVQPYAFVSYLPAGASDYRLLELPITRHYQFDHARMYNQIWHQQPIMGGYLSRPLLVDPYREYNSAYNWLAQQKYYASDFTNEIFTEKAAFNIVTNLAQQDKYSYVVLYKEAYRSNQEISRIKQIVISQVGPDALLQEDDQTALYKILLSAGTAEPGLWLGEGFFAAERNQDGPYRWAGEKTSFYAITDRAGKLKVSFDTLAFALDRRMQIFANNVEIFNDIVTPAQRKLSLEVAVQPGTTEFRIVSLNGATTPKLLDQGDDTRPLAFLMRNLSVSF